MLVDRQPQATRTTCPYCGVGCGVLATARSDGSAEISGDPEHPANFGRLCSKGAALGETLSLDDRLLYPMAGGERTNWDTALELVASKFREAIAAHGPDSVAFYVSGQILTEDYYVANKLMKGFIGTANIDTNSRLCMASSVAGHRRAFGSDTVPGTYEDLEIAELVVLVGSNLAWCHPVLYQRLAAAKETRGTKVVIIDPRETATCDIADIHLALAPGSDVALFNGLLNFLESNGKTDREFVRKHTSGFDEALAVAQKSSLAETAKITGLQPELLTAFYELFAATETSVTVYSQGVNQSIAGTDKVNAIINCHLATGRIGRPGMGPFSVTGQPNAMGGREVGGLANMLAAHMELSNAEHRRIVQTFWNAPRIASETGLKAVDMFRAVRDGRIKAFWIMATNPVVSMPEADTVRAALEACPFVVVSDITRHTDTTAQADVLLPSLGWGEKDGTVTNSERRISRQRAFIASPGEARADWWQMAEVAKRMGFAQAFSYASAAEIFAEYARLTGADNNGTRDLDISRFSGITRKDYDALRPVHWPQPAANDPESSRFFGDGKFFTPDRRARFVSTDVQPLAAATTAGYPLVLNTGRIRDQWHTMTRTAKAPRLMSHIAEPFLEIHPDDAARLGLNDATLARVKSPHGAAVTRVLVTTRQRIGSVFVPMHWNEQYASAARVCALIDANVDPVSGQPELKAAPVAASRFDANWYGFAVSIAKPASRSADYWAIAKAKSGWRAEYAGLTAPEDWNVYARKLLNLESLSAVDILDYHDTKSGQYRFAAYEKDHLVAAIYIAPEPVPVSRTFVVEQLGLIAKIPADRLAVLAGRPGGAVRDRGPIVCACLEVGQNDILEAITKGGCLTVSDVGNATQAGTNCGSCRSEIGKLIQSRHPAEAT